MVDLDKMDIDAQGLGPSLKPGNTEANSSQKKLESVANNNRSQVGPSAGVGRVLVRFPALDKVEPDPATAFEKKETGERDVKTCLNSSSFTLKYHDELNNLSEIFDEPFDTSDAVDDENSKKVGIRESTARNYQNISECFI